MNLNAPAIRQLIDLAEANQDVFIENGKKFWGMPELGYREVKTSKYATDCLESYGLKLVFDNALNKMTLAHDSFWKRWNAAQ